MLKNKSGIEYVSGERKYQFICDNDAPLGELYDASCVFKTHIANIIKEKESAEAKAEEEKKEKSEPKEG